MNEAKLNYVGPTPNLLSYKAAPKRWWTKVPVGFLVIVVLPTVLAAIYYLLIASPRYVSEARFLVRSPGQSQMSSLGFALQGVGISSSQSDAFAVHEYINSRDALQEIKRRYDVRAMLSAANADVFSRYPRPGESNTEEGLFKGFQRFVVVGYDSTSGISTLRVQAFRPKDAQLIAEALLESSETLVNRLNKRSATNAVSEAAAARDQARGRLNNAQQALTRFRNAQSFIDPTLAARESVELIGSLRATLAGLIAERSQIAAEAPASPQLVTLDNRIASYQRQIDAERSKIVGSSDSLAPQVGNYEDLVMDKELADKELASATLALTAAEQDSQRQRLYLERVVNPSVSDDPSLPRRWRQIFTVLLSTLLMYGVGWLIYAGVREHNQG